jgi:ParB family chromosome partitioning protein
MAARRKKPKKGSLGLAAADVAGEGAPEVVAELAEQIAADGGVALATYRDPWGGKWVVLAALPIDQVAATPYQREISPAHVKRLCAVIPKVGRFLDPLVAVRQPAEEGPRYWTPNGMHRLEAMRALGAQAVTALVVPEPEVAFRILALNTEKAHNLKDKSLEVIRMARALAGAVETASRPERDFAFELEEAAYLTLGICYEREARFSGGAYLSVLKRCEELSEKSLTRALPVREAHAARLLELDAAVGECVDRLKQAGFTSAYLKPFVVARINPLRWIRAAKPGQKAPRAEFDGTIEKMLASARKLDVSKIRPQDLAATGGGADEE